MIAHVYYTQRYVANVDFTVLNTNSAQQLLAKISTGMFKIMCCETIE